MNAVTPHRYRSYLFDVCQNECTVFAGTYIDADTCPSCNQSRFKLDAGGARTSLAHKRLGYFPLVDHLQRMFKEHYDDMIAWFHGDRKVEDGKKHFSDFGGTMWSSFLDTMGHDPHNVAVSICLDGVQKSSRTQQSVTPVVVKIESASARIRFKEHAMHMLTLIPPCYSALDTYLRPAVHELASLREHGATIVLADGRTVVSRVLVVQLCGDYRALPGLIGTFRDPSRHACVYCKVRPTGPP